jgi:hypothetical protein
VPRRSLCQHQRTDCSSEAIDSLAMRRIHCSAWILVATFGTVLSVGLSIVCTPLVSREPLLTHELEGGGLTLVEESGRKTLACVCFERSCASEDERGACERGCEGTWARVCERGRKRGRAREGAQERGREIFCANAEYHAYVGSMCMWGSMCEHRPSKSCSRKVGSSKKHRLTSSSRRQGMVVNHFGTFKGAGGVCEQASE